MALGDIVIVRGLQCRIIAIRPFGTVDVESLDGRYVWRLSGLPLTSDQMLREGRF